MKVHEITPAADTDALLAGAQFADAFRVEVDDRDLDARRAAERMMARQPRWAEALLSLRNLLVAPLGLRTSGAGLVPPRDMNAGSPHRRLQRSPSGFSRRRGRDGARRRQAGHRDDAGQDAQLARPDLSGNHHAVSSADRTGPAASGGLNVLWKARI
jgi:hypothetical protein